MRVCDTEIWIILGMLLAILWLVAGLVSYKVKEK